MNLIIFAFLSLVNLNVLACEELFSSELSTTDYYLGYTSELLDDHLIGQVELQKIAESQTPINPILWTQGSNSEVKLRHEMYENFLEHEDLNWKKIRLSLIHI